jgi:hypothetical protein
MLDAICRDLLAWNSASSDRLRLSFNVSPQYLERDDFFKKLEDALAFYDIAPSQFEVEITENICIRNPQHATEQLNKLCQLGVSVAMDDFGTGYSSLAYLHRFPIQTIKIDQSFIKEIQHLVSISSRKGWSRKSRHAICSRPVAQQCRDTSSINRSRNANYCTACVRAWRESQGSSAARGMAFQTDECIRNPKTAYAYARPCPLPLRYLSSVTCGATSVVVEAGFP